MSGLQAGWVLIFGIDTPNKDYGILQSYETVGNTERSLHKGCDGAILAVQEHGKYEELRVTYIPFASGVVDPPAIGNKFLFDSKSWMVSKINDVRVIDGFTNVTLTANYYDQIGESSP